VPAPTDGVPAAGPAAGAAAAAQAPVVAVPVQAPAPGPPAQPVINLSLSVDGLGQGSVLSTNTKLAIQQALAKQLGIGTLLCNRSPSLDWPYLGCLTSSSRFLRAVKALETVFQGKACKSWRTAPQLVEQFI
jgi:hypothetical protein